MVTFNAAAMEQWNLGAHADSAALMASINALMRPGGLTNPGAAMQYVVDNVLGSAGDRCVGCVCCLRNACIELLICPLLLRLASRWCVVGYSGVVLFWYYMCSCVSRVCHVVM